MQRLRRRCRYDKVRGTFEAGATKEIPAGLVETEADLILLFDETEADHINLRSARVRFHGSQCLDRKRIVPTMVCHDHSLAIRMYERAGTAFSQASRAQSKLQLRIDSPYSLRPVSLLGELIQEPAHGGQRALLILLEDHVPCCPVPSAKASSAW